MCMCGERESERERERWHTLSLQCFPHERNNKNIAMTGEVTLRGHVLPIGGLKEKLLAAHRAGIPRVIIPDDNKKDLVEIPKNILDDIKIDTVKSVDEVLKIALVKELKPVEWIEVENIPKSSNEKNVPGSTH